MVMLDEPTAALGVAQTAQVLEPDQRLARARAGRDRDQPQPGRRVRGRRPDRGPAAGAQGGDFTVGDVTREEVVAAITGARRRAEVDRGDATMSTPETTDRHRTGRGGRRFSIRKAFGALARGDLAPVRVMLGIVGHLDDLPDRQRPLPQRDQPLQPDAADRRDGDDLDRRRARPAAGRDRPLGRRRQRPRRRGDGGADRAARLGAGARDLRRARRRDGDRGLQRLHRHPVRRALVRRHARGTARLSGGAAVRARRHRLGQPAAVDHHRPHQHLLRPGRRLGPRRSSGSSRYVAACWRCAGARAAGLEVGAIVRMPCASWWSPGRSSPRWRSSTPIAVCRWRR